MSENVVEGDDSDLIKELLQWVVNELLRSPDAEPSHLVSRLLVEIEEKPEFASLLRTHTLMIQINQGNTTAFQTLVQKGGTAHIGADLERLERVLEALIPKILARNTRSIYLNFQPLGTEGFQGREQELDQLQRSFNTNRTRLVGILSPAGYGKSTLAAAYQATPTFEHRLWINFNEPCSFRHFGCGVLEERGIRVNEKTTDESLVNELISHFANHRFLLVLDNLEALLQPDRHFQDSGYQQFLLGWLDSSHKLLNI